MGSFEATFTVGGETFDVLAVDYEFSRDTNKKGKADSDIYGGRVTVTVESTENTAIAEAMLNDKFKVIDEASIVFKKQQEDSAMKTVIVKEAYVVFYKESFDATKGMTNTFTLSGRTFAIEAEKEAALENNWAGVASG